MDPNKKFTVLLSMEEIQIIGQGLLELPMKISLKIVQSLDRQVQEQMNPAAPAAVVEPAAE